MVCSEERSFISNNFNIIKICKIIKYLIFQLINKTQKAIMIQNIIKSNFV